MNSPDTPLASPSSMGTALAHAYLLARAVHEGQRRFGPDKEPYFRHPERVAENVAQVSGDEATVIAALLHDVVEMSPITLAEISAAFGVEIGDLLWWLTDDEAMEALALAERKEAQVKKIASAPVKAQLVKLADQLDNIIGVLKATKPKRKKRDLTYVQGALAVAKACEAASPALFAKAAQAAEEVFVFHEEPFLPPQNQNPGYSI